MKRKVIQLAGKTLVVSLPSKWAKKYGVKKGAEVEVEEGEGSIVFFSQGQSPIMKKTLDAKDINIMLGRTLGGFYKAGYDEVEISYYSPDQYAKISEVLNRTCIGYEIIKQGQRTILIKNISDLHPDEFQNISRRLFLSLLSSADDTLTYFKQGDLKDLAEIETRDLIITKYSDLCRRMVNIKGMDSTRKTTTYYYICEQLEKVGDAYKDFAKFIIKNKIKQSSADCIRILDEINQLLRLFYELFYDFDFKKWEDFGQRSEKLKKEFASKFESQSLKELKITYNLFRIFSMIFDMNSSLVTANI